VSLQFGSNSFYQKLLNETRPRKPAPPPLDKLAPPQKNTLCSFHFARTGFLFLLMKRVFFCGVLPSKYSGRWRDWPHFDLAREKRNSPHTQYERNLYWAFLFRRIRTSPVECREVARHCLPTPCRRVLALQELGTTHEGLHRATSVHQP